VDDWEGLGGRGCGCEHDGCGVSSSSSSPGRLGSDPRITLMLQRKDTVSPPGFGAENEGKSDYCTNGF